MVKNINGKSRRFVMAAAASLMATLVAGSAAAADRLTDKDIKQLIERVDHERDRFEDQLSGAFKSSTIHSPGRDVNVEKSLDDFQDNVGKLKDRFTSDYAATTEVTTVLQQGSAIERYMATQPPNFDGASEWKRLAGSLGELAAAYGTSFPLPEGRQARRLNDKEIEKVAEGVAKSADHFKQELESSLEKDQTVTEATRNASVNAAEGLKKDAEKLANAIGDERPASGEAQALMQRATAIRGTAAGHALSPAAQTAWRSVESGLATVAQAFNLPTARQ
jgi:hypothetical protein